MYHHHHHHHLLVWTLLLLHPIGCNAASVVMVVTPAAGKISIGDSFSVECDLQNANNVTSLLWYRRQGNIWYKLGSDYILTLSDGSIENGRYQLTQTSNDARNYKLSVSSAKLEDSATIECRLSPDLTVQAVASKSVIVCSDTSSSFCGCMINKGWASPDCFTSALNRSTVDSADSMWRSVVGLSIAFVVIIAYALIILLIGKRESLRQCCQEEQTEDMRNLNDRKSDSEGSDRGQVDQSDSVSESATCSTSDPSGSGASDGQGSGQSAASSRRMSTQKLLTGETAEQESWSANQPINRKAEAALIVKPEIHCNQGYLEDNQESSFIQHRRNRGRQSQPQNIDPISYENNFELKASPLSGQGAYGDVHLSYANFNPRSNYEKRGINSISGSMAGSILALGGDQSQGNINGYYTPSGKSPQRSHSLLSVAGTEI